MDAAAYKKVMNLFLTFDRSRDARAINVTAPSILSQDLIISLLGPSIVSIKGSTWCPFKLDHRLALYILDESLFAMCQIKLKPTESWDRNQLPKSQNSNIVSGCMEKYLPWKGGGQMAGITPPSRPFFF